MVQMLIMDSNMTNQIAQETKLSNRVCKKCLFREMAEEQQKDLKKYLAVIKPQDKVAPGVYEKRLSICKSCDKLLEATCEACGCYVEYRAVVERSHCPKKKW